MGLPEGKILKIYTVSQNRVVPLKIMKFDVNSKQPVLGS